MKKYLISLGILVLPFLTIGQAKAFCPVCTAAVIAGLGLSRWLKIDDTISGLWIGAIIVLMIWWTISWTNKRKLIFFGKNILIAIAFYIIVVLPLFYYNIAGHPLNRLWGIDKLILGISIGSLFFGAGYFLHSFLKKKNKEKVFFPFQRVIIPITPLLILSFVFYFITRH